MEFSTKQQLHSLVQNVLKWALVQQRPYLIRKKNPGVSFTPVKKREEQNQKEPPLKEEASPQADSEKEKLLLQWKTLLPKVQWREERLDDRLAKERRYAWRSLQSASIYIVAEKEHRQLLGRLKEAIDLHFRPCGLIEMEEASPQISFAGISWVLGTKRALEWLTCPQEKMWVIDEEKIYHSEYKQQLWKLLKERL